jgi:uncharacterized protein (TIGR03086 family)
MAESSRAELLALFQRAQAQFTDRVDAVPPGRWNDPALPAWTVADLVAHLTAEQLWVPPLLAGEPLDVVALRIPTSTEALLAGDPLTAWETAADTALTAWALHVGRDDALDDGLRRTVELTRGPTPSADYLVELTADLTVHSWDLARAVDGVMALDPDLVAAALDYADAHLGSDGIPGLIDPPVPVPAGADPLTRLLGRFGRRVPA